MYWVSVYKSNVQILSQMLLFTKKESYNSTSLQDKQRCRTILNLEEKMRRRFVKRELFNVITWSLGHTSQNRWAFVFIEHIHLFKWAIVSLDKTLIHRLISFIALWSCTETVFLTFNRLESIEVHYMEIIRAMFSSKTLISFRLKKEIQTHLGWHGVSK